MNRNFLYISALFLLFAGAFFVKQQPTKLKVETNPDLWKRFEDDSPIATAPKMPKNSPPSFVERRFEILTDYKKGDQISRAENRPMFLFFHADWCTYCKKMERKTLNQSSVMNKLKNYVVVFIDTDKNPNLRQKFGVKMLPTYLIVLKDQTKKSGAGYKDSRDFLQWLEN